MSEKLKSIKTDENSIDLDVKPFSGTTYNRKIWRNGMEPSLNAKNLNDIELGITNLYTYLDNSMDDNLLVLGAVRDAYVEHQDKTKSTNPHSTTKNDVLLGEVDNVSLLQSISDGEISMDQKLTDSIDAMFTEVFVNGGTIEYSDISVATSEVNT
jgi:hypothetical protein